MTLTHKKNPGEQRFVGSYGNEISSDWIGIRLHRTLFYLVTIISLTQPKAFGGGVSQFGDCPDLNDLWPSFMTDIRGPTSHYGLCHARARSPGMC